MEGEKSKEKSSFLTKILTLNKFSSNKRALERLKASARYKFSSQFECERQNLITCKLNVQNVLRQITVHLIY